MKNIALIVAAGNGARIGVEVPKQYLKVQGVPILRWSIMTFLSNPQIDAVQVVIGEGQEEQYNNAVNGLKLLPVVIGGANRQNSVLNGLKALEYVQPENILIHDAARPFVTQKIINDSISALELYEAVDVALPVKDTLKYKDTNKGIINRDEVYSTQTPQSFKFNTILELHQKYADNEFTDDLSLALQGKTNVGLVEGSIMNFKITTKEDLIMANHMKQYEYRTGIGYDVHQVISKPNSKIAIGGVLIPADYEIVAHSDGDVVLHAVVDALLGALSLGDIGHFFPPSDPKWKDVDSKVFLKHAVDQIRNKGAEIVNIDCTIIAEKPKIKPYIEEIKKTIADCSDLVQDRISIKATTSEKLGFIGRQEGIACHAICNIRKILE